MRRVALAVMASAVAASYVGGAASGTRTENNAMARQSARRQPRKLTDQPEAPAVPKTRLRGRPRLIAAGVATERTVPPHQMPAAPDDAIALGERLASGFAAAVRGAVAAAHAAGLAAPGREEGMPVERRPDGRTAPIDGHTAWTPTDWKRQA